MVAYFLPLRSGAYKVYSTPDSSFWCCVGSGFESHAKYAESIYFHQREKLFVNLFIPSVLHWKEKGIRLRQETRFPEEETVVLSIEAEQPVQADICLRYPSWSRDIKVEVNGHRVKVNAKPGSYITLHREWQQGDRIEMTYPMSFSLETTPDDKERAALLYGPVVLAGELGTESMRKPSPYSDPTKYNDYYTYDYHIPEGIPTGLTVDRKHPERSLKRIGKGLIFKTKDGMKLSPLYDIHRQRYVVYWNLKEE
jgi:DUF1680 family protein